MVQAPLRAAAFSSPPGECTREPAEVAPQEHQHAWTGEEGWRQMEKKMTVLSVRIRSVCLFSAGVQEVDQCGAAEHAVGHLSSLHIQKRLLQKGMEQSGDEWDKR